MQIIYKLLLVCMLRCSKIQQLANNLTGLSSCTLPLKFNAVPVAQWLEHPAHNRRVRSSNLCRTIRKERYDKKTTYRVHGRERHW